MKLTKSSAKYIIKLPLWFGLPVAIGLLVNHWLGFVSVFIPLSVMWLPEIFNWYERLDE